jgi:hypothetical protein
VKKWALPRGPLRQGEHYAGISRLGHPPSVPKRLLFSNHYPIWDKKWGSEAPQSETYVWYVKHALYAQVAALTSVLVIELEVVKPVEIVA